MKCPLKVFTLPLSITFTLNEVEYKGNILQVIYREREDPFLKEHVDWHLNLQLNWSSLAKELDSFWTAQEKEIIEESKDLKVFEFSHNTGFGTMEVISIVLGIILLIMSGTWITCRLRKRRRSRRSTKENPEPDEEEVQVPLQPINHHIIVQG